MKLTKECREFNACRHLCWLCFFDGLGLASVRSVACKGMTPKDTFGEEKKQCSGQLFRVLNECISFMTDDGTKLYDIHTYIH